MKIEKIIYSDRFSKKFKKYSSKEEQIILKKVKIFWENPFFPILKTHKLKGNLSEFWSFSISSNLRIIFKIDRNIIEFINIGTHEIYKQN